MKHTYEELARMIDHSLLHPTMTDQELEGQPPQEVRKYLQQTHDRIFENNKKWADEMKKSHPEFFENLSAGQAPDYLWIGESRPPSLNSREP